MAKIVYSMAGEGRGHATRVRAMVEELRADHRLILYAPGDAHDLLEPAYRDTEVEVRPHSCLRFHYVEKRLDPSRTVWESANYVRRLPELLRRLRRDLERDKPDLVISDFEPALPRAARRVGIPFLSLDHQHFLLVNDLSGLPTALRAKAWLWGQAVRLYFSGQVETVVSSFFMAPIRAAWQGRATPVATLLRPEVLRAERRRDGHLVLYLRKFSSPALFTALKACGRTVHIYGLGEKADDGPLRFHAIDQARFLEHLATGDALISTAGNQVVGEALYLGKPVLAMPETDNHEQYINAHFLRQLGVGDWVELAGIKPSDLTGFLGRLDEFHGRIDPTAFNGNPAALAVVRRHLPAPVRPAPVPLLAAP